MDESMPRYINFFEFGYLDASIKIMRPCAIVYHYPCFDGLASALLAESHLKRKGYTTIEFHTFSYGKRFKSLNPCLYHEIMIVDLPRAVLSSIISPVAADANPAPSCTLLTWIDHHPFDDSSIDGLSIDGSRDLKFDHRVESVVTYHNDNNCLAACGLAFASLTHSYEEPSIKSYPLMHAIDCCDRGVAPSTIERAVYYQIIFGNNYAMDLTYLRKYLGLTYTSPLVAEIARLHIKPLPGLDHSGVTLIDNILHSIVRSNRHRVLCLDLMGERLRAMEIYIADQSGLIIQEYIRFASKHKTVDIDFIVRVKSIPHTDNVLVIMRRVNPAIDLNVIAKHFGAGGHPGAATFMTTYEKWQSMIMNHDK